MRKITTQLAIAFLTFSIGIVITGLRVTHRFQQGEELSPFKHIINVVGILPSSLDGWQKIVVEGKFSFYLPPNMKKDYPSVERQGILGHFYDNSLIILYVYGEHVECSPTDAHASQAAYESTKVVMAEKEAWLNDRESKKFNGQDSPMKWPWMTLCFPDIGDGKTKLYWQVSSPYPGRLSEIKRMLNSIEFK